MPRAQRPMTSPSWTTACTSHNQLPRSPARLSLAALMSQKLHFALLRRPLALWLAVLISVFGALAPTLSHAFALAHSGMSPMVQICTSTGPHEVTSAIATVSPDGQQLAPVLEHCPFCLLTADQLGPPACTGVHVFTPASALARSDKPVLFFETFTSSSALPRGPPRFFW